MAKADKDRKVLWNYMGKTTSQKRWTPSAIMCYERHCVCKGCYYEEFFKSSVKCQMKAAVIELVRKVGVPKKETEENNNEQS